MGRRGYVKGGKGLFITIPFLLSCVVPLLFFDFILFLQYGYICTLLDRSLSSSHAAGVKQTFSPPPPSRPVLDLSLACFLCFSCLASSFNLLPNSFLSSFSSNFFFSASCRVSSSEGLLVFSSGRPTWRPRPRCFAAHQSVNMKWYLQKKQMDFRSIGIPRCAKITVNQLITTTVKIIIIFTHHCHSHGRHDKK